MPKAINRRVKTVKKIFISLMLFVACITLTCCGNKNDILIGLPEIKRNETVYYNAAVVEEGENLGERRPVTECPYDNVPSRQQAQLDGGVIIWTNGTEHITRNTAALERFVNNVNHGVDDSLLVLKISAEGAKETASAYFYYFINGEIWCVESVGEIQTEEMIAKGEDAKLFLYKRNGFCGAMVTYPMIIGSIVSGYMMDFTHARHAYSTFTKLSDDALLYDENTSQRFVDVAGVYEGEYGEAKLYMEYPFAEKFPTAKEIFELGGMVIFNNNTAVKAYNTLAIDRFKESVNSGKADTLFVYTDDGEPKVVMYSFTGECLVVTEDARKYEPLKGLYTKELFGRVFVKTDNEAEQTLKSEGLDHKREYSCYTISVTATQKDGSRAFVSNMASVPDIQYVKTHIMPEADAEKYR